LGSAARFTPGGKGANQAVAAARLGADVRMAGCVGDDDFGRRLLAALRDEGVGDEGVRVTADAPTGLAMISVAPAANHEVGPAEVRAALTEPQNVLVVCAEIPVEVIVAALARHRASIPTWRRYRSPRLTRPRSWPPPVPTGWW